MLLDRFLHIQGLVPLLTVRPGSVEVALHDVVFTVDLRQAACRLNEDQPIHAVGNVFTDRRRGTVIHVQAGIDRFEGELRSTTRSGVAAGGSTPGAGHGVKVDVVPVSYTH